MKIEINKNLKDLTKNIDFSELCITSKAEVIYSVQEETLAETIKAKGSKCSVCWKISQIPCQRHSCPKSD